MPENTRERDLVLAPNEYAFISDQTKGNINVYVGPYKTSLANTDQPVTFIDSSKQFSRCNLETAIKTFSIAPEGWYVVMKNPGKDSIPPKTGTVSSFVDLNIGRKVNIPGPTSFALWPGQMVRVLQGHHLHSNQYLIVRIYDEEAAKENWKKAVVKPQTGAGSGAAGSSTPDGSQQHPSFGNSEITVNDITMGKLLAIKGTEVSFYIPPTGIEVVRDENNRYVREAVSLERLEYCILLDEDGNKRFIQGPAVVFPRPSETFVEKNGSRKFKAIELNEISGLYIKVIAAYKEDGHEYKVGQELFITGKDQMIYVPRPEHAIIKYGGQEIHYAVAIPAGEGRYVLNRETGKVALKRGPTMFLPDPRTEVIVRRLIDPKQCEIWFPGNIEVLEYNRRLKALSMKPGNDYLTEREVKNAPRSPSQAPAAARLGAAPAGAALRERMEDAIELPQSFAGDDFNRSQTYTPPRTITLDTKFEGAVSIDVWTGYACLVVSKLGERKVIVGPSSYLLEYDESLESIILSTGTPKTDEHLLKTSYLRVLHNKVSDLVLTETKDLCKVSVRISYRVNFEGDPKTWFNVENFVKFLCDHMRSLIRNAVKGYGIETFYADAIKIVRDTVLGMPVEGGHRPGRLFKENGMRIYDVEVLDVTIGDETIAALLVETQHEIVQQTVLVTSEKRKLETTQQTEDIKRKTALTQADTRRQELELQASEVKKQLEVTLAKIESEVMARQRGLQAKLAEQEAMNQIGEEELSRQRASSDLEIEIAQKKLNQRLLELKNEVDAVVAKATAVSPDLIAALQGFSDRALAEKMADSMAPLAILGGKSLTEVFSQLLKGTNLEGVLKSKELKK
ncbi:MAG: hypothetical protein HQM09_20185 [Candidatus Riflebacteria bacterium]|nr:hypothetical protein [Candidatus Riflebacteria bacterium]